MVHLPDPFGQQAVEIECSIDETLTITRANQCFQAYLTSPDQPYKTQSAFHFLDISPRLQQELIAGIQTHIRHEPVHFHAALKNVGTGNTTFYWTARPIFNQQRQLTALSISGQAAGRYLGTPPVPGNPAHPTERRGIQPVPDMLDNIFFLDLLLEGVVLFDKKCVIIYANDASETILGLSKQALLGRSTLDPGWKTIHEDGSPFEPFDHPCTYTIRTGEACRHVVMGIPGHDGAIT